VKLALQGAGLVKKARKRGVHRKRRERKPLPGMLLHIDGSKHQWFGDERWYDLIVIMDDATSEIYYAQLVDEESTRTVMAALREVVETKGAFCSLYSDRASHFFETPRAGESVDRNRLTQVGRALKDLGIEAIPAYSPQARGRSERTFGTWQGRLPNELQLRGITSVEQANRFLREQYIADHNRKFTVAAAQSGSAFVPVRRRNLDVVFSIQQERVLQLNRTKMRATLAGCRVVVCQHLNGTITVLYCFNEVGKFSEEGVPINDANRPSKNNKRSNLTGSRRRIRIAA
jgi:hypothetical protein